MTDAIRLLILDDDPLTGQTITNIATLAGVDARYTDDPLEFFRLIKEMNPDFIALDLVMPRMDGVQVMVELARLRCPADIIISSGVGGRVLDAAARSASEHGLNIVGVLPKPFSPARLRELLSRQPAGSAPALHRPANPDDSESIPAHELADAISRNDITVVYQPKINCRTGLLAGFEVLARWQHPTRGAIGPDRFIPLAEQSGLIDALTESVMLQSLRWYSALPASLGDDVSFDYLRRRLREITLSVNISASSLSHLDLFERLDDYCQSMGIRPERIIFELTETCAMEDPVSSLDILTRLRMKGFHLSIDDFGTGFSSMLQLARLPFSEIKIDKSFVMTAGESKESRTVIKTIIDLGHGLGLYTSAEGIESNETLEYLRSIGCDLAQGYAIARPMTGDAVLTWLRKGRNDDEEHRLQVLHSLNILDTEADERFDRITRLATRLFQVPISLFSLVDSNRQWFKSAVGLDVRETARDISFCTHAIREETILVVNDAHIDPRFRNNDLVTGAPHIRFYAGCPVHADTGIRLGTLCLIDHKPREFSLFQQKLLKHVAQMVENELTADYVAHEDPLTSLLNRRGFDARSIEAIALCHDAGLHACLFLFDLLEFKHFNEQHGPAAGDRALIEFNRLLRDTFRGSDLIARYGDDDFVVLMIDITPPGPEKALARLAAAAELCLSEHPIRHTAGWAMLEDGDSSQQLILRASQSMQLLRNTSMT
ncbi:MAG: EAL domain-containing protein [Pseudohongiella sp.]|nr:EAL domain-containing protein [Pseudohongiella sp.]MDP2128691.1 EAL domain-containing protein [Pseudohongiella sp.]